DPNASGEFPSYGVSVSPAVWKKAGAACKAQQPPGTLSAKLTPAQESAALKFAQCIRENGVPDFPDPVNGQPLVDTTRIPSSNKPGRLTIDGVATGSSVDTSSAACKQAVSTCKDHEPSGFTGHERSPQEQKAALEFAQCIRDNGVKDFPDPGKTEPLVDTNRIPSAT